MTLFPFADYWWFYGGFLLFVFAMLSIDLGMTMVVEGVEDDARLGDLEAAARLVAQGGGDDLVFTGIHRAVGVDAHMAVAQVASSLPWS